MIKRAEMFKTKKSGLETEKQRMLKNSKNDLKYIKSG